MKIKIDKITNIINRIEKHWNGVDYVDCVEFEEGISIIVDELKLDTDDIVLYNFYDDERDEKDFIELTLYGYQFFINEKIID